jgi:hypothetical protein
MEGCVNEGCVSGAGKAGSEAGPEDGARLIAPPEGSGTEAGGTGGGLSVNICAETGDTSAKTSMDASASRGHGRPPHLGPSIPLPPRVMGMLFTENAANSSLKA